MSQQLILLRHGNTFNPQNTPVWVGARSDLPLVEKGLQQAIAAADALHDANILPDIILAGPLQRTRHTAEVIADKLQISTGTLRVDKRLKEIDYGAWEGKSTDEIIATGGGVELEAWNKRSIFPTTAGWTPSENQIIADTRAVLDEASEDTGLLVTSNGILRFFARDALNQADFPERKVLTGHICVMEREEKGWRILRWNQPPSCLTK